MSTKAIVHDDHDDGSEATDSLSLEVTKRVNALRRLQAEQAKLDAEFHKEVLKLDLKYNSLKQPLYGKRKDIVAGTYEPTEEEAKPLEGEQIPVGEPGETPAVGIPNFWLTALQSHPYIAQLIEEHDGPVLDHLTDIQLEWLPEATPGFRLTFFFSKNEYFKNEVLTKTYYMDYSVEEGEVLCEGPTYVKAEGCAIDWYDGKDVTVRIEKKKQKKKGGKDAGKTRTITKTVPQDSFFHFFKPPQLPEDADEQEDSPELEMQRAMLSQDFDVGDIFKDRLIPNAVLFFTGEASQGDDYDDDEFGEEGDFEYGGDDDEDEDDEPEPAPAPKGGKGKSGGKPGGAPAGQNPECKQQ